jgi:glycosyltransferase involved in cell wall biosynthesis
MKKSNTNKKILGIVIPYYKNSNECEIAAKKLMEVLVKQLTDDMILYIYEDGQFSDWLYKYAKPDKIIYTSCDENKGVSWARNSGLDYLIDEVKYILFIDSDDMVEDNYLKVMYEYCADMTHEIVESTIVIKDQIAKYDPKLIRCGVAGSALQTKIIGNIRFDESLQIGEDTKFMHDVIDLTKYRKRHAPTKYFYQLGINNNSLTMLHSRNEIGKER